MADSLTAVQPTGWIRIDLTIDIEAPRERVWQAIVEETGAWWLPDFYATPNPETVLMEPVPGGRVFEKSTDGGGLLWYQIQSIVPNESLHMTGQLAPPFGGPATSLLHLRLESDQGKTVLTITDCLFGNVDESTGENIEAGWRMLYGDGLKKYVESK